MDDGNWEINLIAKPNKTQISCLLSDLTDIPLEHLRRLPGDEDTWRTFIGIHEGMHVNQESPAPPRDTDEKRLLVLKNEVEADRAGIEYLRSLGREDMVQAWKDYRALAAHHDPLHATSIFLDNDTEVTDAHLQALAIFDNEIYVAVAGEMGLDILDPKSLLKAIYESIKLFKTEPEKYIDIVNRLVEHDEIASMPEVTAHIKDYAEAYRRQVLEAHFDPAVPSQGNPGDPRHIESCGHIHIHSDGMEKDKLLIGGKRAPDYFEAQATKTEAIPQPEKPALTETGFNPPRPGLR